MMTAKKRTRSPLSRAALMEELVAELRCLRAMVREVGESFILRKEGELETLVTLLETVPTTVLKRESAAWRHGIRDLNLKPAKGRLKDLKEIAAMVAELSDRVVSAQEGKKGAGKGRMDGEAGRRDNAVMDRG
jgi:hypothetical protein